MDGSREELRERLRAAAKGGPDAVLDALAGMGMAVEKDPQPGVGVRMRFGAGTDDAFTSTMYLPSSERPRGWPAEVPFLPDVGGSLTLFERAGRGFSVQWFKVPDAPAAATRIVTECRAAGWRESDDPAASDAPAVPGSTTTVLERGEVRRLVTSLVAGEMAMVQLVERRPGDSCSLDRGPAGP